MHEDRLNELIAKELAGESSSAEKQELKKLLLGNKEYSEWYDFFKTVWTDRGLDYKSNLTDSAFNKLSDKLNIEDRFYINPETVNKSYNLKRAFFLRIAAIFLFVITAAFLARFFIYQETDNVEPENVVKMLEREVPKGQKARIYLPDGSIVWLNAESTLRYPERFEDNNRTVFLKGEAYFEVEKDSAKPFSVKTERIVVTALGTTFDVRAYSEYDEEVALNTGKVLVKINDDQVILEPGQGIHLPKNTDLMKLINVVPEESFLWKDGLIYFEEATFSEVLEKLSRWYGVKFNVKNYNGKSWKYSATFKNEYLRNILESMSYSKDFTYEINDDNVSIIFKK